MGEEASAKYVSKFFPIASENEDATQMIKRAEKILKDLIEDEFTISQIISIGHLLTKVADSDLKLRF